MQTLRNSLGMSVIAVGSFCAFFAHRGPGNAAQPPNLVEIRSKLYTVYRASLVTLPSAVAKLV